MINFSADSIPIPNSPDTFVKLFLPSDTMTHDKQSLFNYGVRELESFEKPTRFQKTLGPDEECLFYVVAIFYQTNAAAQNQQRGGNRAELVLKGQNLFYRMSPQIDLLPCGQIISRRWVLLYDIGERRKKWPGTDKIFFLPRLAEAFHRGSMRDKDVLRMPLLHLHQRWRINNINQVSKLNLKTDPKVEAIFANYPDFVRDKMQHLRELVIKTAEETEGITVLEETLKWGEPSFVTKNGSTLRMDWKEKTPDQYAMYFQCTSRLVDTFRLVFDHKFQYKGKRAIIFQLNQKIPELELKECIKASLTYHKVKEQITLGIWNWMRLRAKTSVTSIPLARMEKMIEMGFTERFKMTLNSLEGLLATLSKKWVIKKKS